MILSKEYGLVLFHLDSVWIEGEKYDAGKTRTKLPPGTEVKFYDKTYQGAEYKELSEDQVIHQAVAVWTGDRPDHLLKKIKDEDDKKINIFFNTDDVMIFKKNIREYNQSAKNLLPVGCLVSCDARRVHISGIKNVEYRAIHVLAGFWPLTPPPTLFPGGQGSAAPMYDLPAGTFTFYYLE